MRRLGIDVGGTSLKGAVVDLTTGALMSPTVRVDTPSDFTLDSVTAAVLDLVGAAAVGEFAVGELAVGVGFPAVVRRGIVCSPPTAHEFAGWVGVDLAAHLTATLHRPVGVANDADAAGLAEMAFGVAHGRAGVVIVLTLGTGVGSAVFVDGALVPNTELGKLYLAGDPAVVELAVAGRVKTEDGLSFSEWGPRLAAYLDHLDRLFTPDLIVIGGGISADWSEFAPYLQVRCEVVPARLRNDAGIVGAALA
jgi:polyphosphate glucokinase